MEKTTTKASFFLVLIFLIPFLSTIGGTEGSRNVPKKDNDDEVYNPQNFFGFPGGFGPFKGGPGFGGFPGMGFHGGFGPFKGGPGFSPFKGGPGFGPFGGIPGFGGPGKGGDGPFPEAAINGVGGRKSP